MLVQTSQERYGEGYGLVLEFGNSKNCIDIFLASTPRLHLNITDRSMRSAVGFFNLEITLGKSNY